MNNIMSLFDVKELYGHLSDAESKKIFKHLMNYIYSLVLKYKLYLRHQFWVYMKLFYMHIYRMCVFTMDDGLFTEWSEIAL